MLWGVRSNQAGCAAALAMIVLITTAWQTPPPPPSRIPTAGEIDSVLRELSAVTGFRIRRQLPFELITREQVNKYLREQIRQSVKPDEIRAEEVTLKKFGFAPADFDLKQTTIDLLTEQAAAFYDFHRKKLFISDWATVNMRDAALIHELAHALADQNFPIQKYLSKGASDSEASMAREAVVEGQASWLMLEVTARRSGRTLSDPQTASELMASGSDSDDSAYPVFSKAPLYLRRTLLFPYDDGERFQQAIFLHDGQTAFARVFRQAPVSTAQIMHPDRYFSTAAPTSPDLPKPIKHAKPFVEGSLGELETRILLEQYDGADAAEALGPKLKGADYRIDEVKTSHRMMLLYLSDWSDEDSAAQYFDAYQKVLRAKWKQIEVTVKDAARFSGKSEDGYFAVVRDGARILSEEGFADPPRTPILTPSVSAREPAAFTPTATGPRP
jgi:hypothetical protein